MDFRWNHVLTIDSRSFTCGYCGNPLASEKGYLADIHGGRGGLRAYIYICHHCERPTFFDVGGDQTPGIRPGEDVKGIDDAGVQKLFEEARDSYSKNAFTASVLCCRKLLMHIAVSKGAKEGKSFVEYVEFLSSKGYVPPDAKDWVDHIRTKGNEANHEIAIMSEEEAKDLIAFVVMLLKLIYEFPNKMKGKQTQ